MKKTLLCGLLLQFLLQFTPLLSFGQEKKPYYPLPEKLKPIKDPNAGPVLSNAFGNTATGFSPSAPPEAAFSNRFKDIPVNLYTGTPIINLPLYTLSEAATTVPISLNYNSSGMKAHEVATWAGMGWSLNAGGMITRVVQDIPDEGKFEMTSLTSDTYNHLKGYYTYGYSTLADNHDHEPDIYYLNIGGASYKFIYKYNNGGKFVFFPDADIDVQMQTNLVPGSSIVRYVTKWVVTMPDGIKYEFGDAFEESTEIEVKYAQTNDIEPWNPKFQRYWKGNVATSAWYLKKIISPYGHEINFDYKTSTYSFFRLAENEGNGVCPQPSTVDKKINRVYVRSSSLYRISSRTVKIEFNKEKLDCGYLNPETGEYECVLDPNSIPSRRDIDGFFGGPSSLSDAKKLVEMNVMDNVASPTDTLKYSFEYDHFISADSTSSDLPYGYTISDVGKSHARRLRLKQINLPDSTNYKFNYYYENAPTTFYSRLTYGVDHWGFLNGNLANAALTGLIPRDYFFPGCTNASNRDTDSLYAKYGLLEKITVPTGSQTTFDYEPHKAENYKNGSNYIPIGGARIKQINNKDLISGIETIKKYDYRSEDSTKSSGFLAMKPIYRFHKNTTPYANSGLYEYLLNQTGRPTVAYSHVTEKITTTTNENAGFTTHKFDLYTYEPTIKTVINCFPGPCDTVYRAELFAPEHDYIGGTLLRTRQYNSSRQLLAEQLNTYFISYYDYSFGTGAYKVIRFNNQFISNAYTLYFRKYRLKQTENIAYSQAGTTPVTTKTEYYYKDDISGGYQTKYKGKHNFVVRTRMTDSYAVINETWSKYIADYEFCRDTVVCEYYPDTQTTECYSYPICVPPLTNTDAYGIYQMKTNHLLSQGVESFSTRGGKLTGASYNSYRSFSSISSPFKYHLKRTFSTDSLGKNSFFEAVYDNTIYEIKKDLSYYPVVEYQDYNPIGLPLKVKPLGGAVSKVTYDALNVLSLEQTQNEGGTTQLKTTSEVSTKIFGVSKQIAPNLLEARTKYYSDSRVKQTEDKDGNILSHFEYRYKGQSLLTTSGAFTTDTSKNRVIARNPRIATSNPYQDENKINTEVNYNDGSGRNLQSVGYKVSPTKKDIISGSITFDNFGRPNKNILPVGNLNGNGNFQNNALTLAQTFYNNDSIPYNQVKQYEASPLSRVFKTFGAGGAFRPNAYAEQKYETGNFSVWRYDYNEGTDFISQNTFYTGNELVRERTIDERGNIVRTYTDKLGRTVQKDVQYINDGSSESDYLKTAYVYDNLGRLAVIIPPKIYGLTGAYASSSLYTTGLYIFKYDHRGRVITKHVPNAGWSYVVYDKQNKPILTQNARQKQEKQWLFTKTDAFGRNIMTGVLNLDKSRDTLQKYFDTYIEENLYEERDTSLSAQMGYTKRSFPSSITLPDSAIKTVNYYDDYNWKPSDSLNFQKYIQPKYDNAKGLMTGNKVRNLKTGEFLRTVMYYDDKNRLIQSKSENRFGLVNQTDAVYNFAGDLLEDRTIYRKLSTPAIISKTNYLFDHIGRKTQTIHQLNNNAPEILASYEYDEIGRMIRKNLNEAQKDSIVRQNESLSKGIVDVAKKYVLLQPSTVINSDSTYYAFIGMGLQHIDYSYNIRGNLRGINLTPTDRLDSSKIFALKLDYFEDGRYYDGNLSRQSWKTHQDTLTRKFLYGYDKANRITSAYYSGKGSENYSLSNIAYDANGNIKRLSRKGFISAGTWGNIDSLSYTYTGTGIPNDVSNKLFNVQDAINSSIGLGDFKNNSFTPEEYFYYDDGSLKADLNKGIDSIKYNYMGLPTRIYFDSDKYIENIYTADGAKLTQRIVNGATIIQTDYIGDLLYKNDTLVSILHDEGKIRFDTVGQIHYQYSITDHLGNNRVIFEKLNDSTYITQESHYGAWGELLQGIGTQGNWKFLFQGKEFVDAFGYDSYDFHARQYDPLIGRFNSVDPVDNYMLSSYAAMANNPTSFIDPDGRNPIVIGFMIGMGISAISNMIKGTVPKSLGQALAPGIVGAISGGIGAGVNVAMAGGSFGAGFIGNATGVASTGFWSGAATGASAGFSNGFLNSVSSGNTLNQSFKIGATQALFGGILGGVGGGISSSSKDLNFWNGTAKLDLSNGVGAHGVITNDPITGKYAGQFEGVDVYESAQLGTGYGSGGITLPGRGITVGKGAFSKALDMDLVGHEFGHTLQIKALGAVSFLKDIGIPSIKSANNHGVGGHSHTKFWTEVWANRLSHSHFNYNFNNGRLGRWDISRFPLRYNNMQDWLKVYNLIKK